MLHGGLFGLQQLCINFIRKTKYNIYISYIYSVGEVRPNPESPLASIKWDKNIKYSLIYFLFAGLWIGAFIMALCQFVIASSCSIWYWAQEQTHKPISRSVYRAFRYHLGSLALGSLLLAIIQMIRLILAYIDVFDILIFYLIYFRDKFRK